jgi:putative salt-induced outer membrane protein YdiY
MKHLRWLALIVLLGAAPGRSEVVMFKNGDQLTGSWLRVVDGKMQFKAEVVGEVAIPIAKVRSFRSEKPAVVILKDGKSLRGGLSITESGEIELKSNGQATPVPTKSIVAIYPMKVYQPRGEERPPRPWTNWRGKGNFGYSLVRGDQDARTISLGVDATRRQPDLPGLRERFRTHYFLNLLFANTTSTSGIRVSANSVTSGLRQDFLFTPSNFVFLLGQLDHIQAQSLNLRQTYGGGFGHDLLHGPRLELSFLGGTTFVQEDFETPVKRRNVEGLVGEKFSWRIFERLSFAHFLNFYPNLTDRGEYRFDTTSTLSARVSSRLSFNTTFTRHFLSKPLPGRKNSETVLTTGLAIDF